MSNYKHLTKDKFKFVHEEIEIKDEQFRIKPVGYYQDAWNRFKKNKASVIAMYFILGLLILTIIGPHFRKYDLPETDGKMALHFDKLPPRAPGFENLGILDGTKVIKNMTVDYYESLPEGIAVKNLGSDNPEQPDKIDVVVNYYRYHRYSKIYGKRLNSDGTREQVIFTLSANEYQRALERNAVVRLVSVSGNDHRVQLDIYKYALNQDVDDVYFWFGTSNTGHDLFTMLWKGSQISLLMALAVSIINVTIGVLFGSIVGYFGATLDIIVERIVEVISNIPFLVVLTLLLLRFGSGLGVIVFAFVSTGWIGAYSTSRVQTYRYKNREYVLAARSYGASDSRIIAKHILPNAIGTLITAFSLTIPYFIFGESTYSYLGIINYPGISSVGRLLADGQGEMQRYFHLLLFPALYLSILMLSFNLFSNGLRDAFNPSLRGVDE